MKTLLVVLHETDVQNFLAEGCTDIDAAVEQYRAEYERRLREQYPNADVRVEAGETNGMGDYVYIDGCLADSDCDEIPWIEQPLSDMADGDWEWLTVPYVES